MVEARRIELLSENLFIQFSPSAVFYLKFPYLTAKRQAERLSSPQYLCKARTLFTDVHHYSTPVPMPWYSSGRRRLKLSSLEFVIIVSVYI